jgi:predicted nucleic acid-binding protein
VNPRVLDASVAIAWYLPEAFSADARRWRTLLLDGNVRLLVPSLHFWEVGNVLRTYVRRGELEESLALEIYDTHLQAPLHVAEPTRNDVLRIALEYEATVYDAVYIALSLAEEAPLLTGERTTAPWVVKLGRLAESVGRARR